MKRVSIFRGESTTSGTFGALSVETFKCLTLELPWKNNTPQVSCIPDGLYVCRIVKSPKFGLVYKIFDVPHRDACLIHPANFAGDSALGYDTQLHGCIALGKSRARTKSKSGLAQYMLATSRPTVAAFMKYMDNKSFELEIQHA